MPEELSPFEKRIEDMVAAREADLRRKNYLIAAEAEALRRRAAAASESGRLLIPQVVEAVTLLKKTDKPRLKFTQEARHPHQNYIETLRPLPQTSVFWQYEGKKRFLSDKVDYDFQGWSVNTLFLPVNSSAPLTSEATVKGVPINEAISRGIFIESNYDSYTGIGGSYEITIDSIFKSSIDLIAEYLAGIRAGAK